MRPLAPQHFRLLAQRIDATAVEGQGVIEGGEGVVVVAELVAVELTDANPPVARQLRIPQPLHQLAVLLQEIVPQPRSTG